MREDRGRGGGCQEPPERPRGVDRGHERGTYVPTCMGVVWCGVVLGPRGVDRGHERGTYVHGCGVVWCGVRATGGGPRA